jgi:signal transduction histidine kinase
VGSRGSSFSGMAVPEIAVGEEQRVPRASTALSALMGRAPLALGIATLAAAYYGAAKVGYALEFSGPVAAVVWLPVGVGISFLYFGGIRLWPGLLIGDILANQYSTLPVASALGQTAGNLLEVIVAVLLLHRLVPLASPLSSVRGVTRMLFAIAAGAAISATVGPLSLLLGGVLTADSLPTVWRTWWLGDFSGGLVVLPLALAWWPPRPVAVRARIVEASLLLLALVVTGEVTSRAEGPWTYLCFCALIWAGLRFGTRGVSLAIVIVVAFTVWNTMHYAGPFASVSQTVNVLGTQLFIAVAAVSALCLAAVVSERERIAEQLGASRARVIETADNERRRIERNLHDGAQQRLLALAVRFELAGKQAEAVPERAAGLLTSASAELQLALAELRELAHGIHPSVLSHLGLADAIRSLASRSTVPVRLLALPSVRLDESGEATAYYVLSEATTNAQKHAQASAIQLRASFSQGMLTAEIADDGVGGAVEGAGTGLLGLRDRVEAAGGTLEIVSPAGQGTRVTARIPAVLAARLDH